MTRTIRSELILSIRAAVPRGLSNAELIAMHPHASYRTVETYAALERRRQGIPKRAPGGVGALIFADVMRGLSTPDLIALHPQFKPSTIKGVASRLRAEHGIHRGYFERQPLKIPQGLASALTSEALARGSYPSGNSLALRLLSIIVKDNMFDAVLDDGA